MVRQRILRTVQSVGFRPPKGRKEVWLPSWTITLMRTPWLPPNMASFKVPLNINKLDLKDYLFNAYGIPILSVRSYIKQVPAQKKEGTNKWYRPRSLKRMIVEMDNSLRGGAFLWPEEVKDLEAWDKKQYDAAGETQEQQRRELMRYGARAPVDTSGLAAQVSALREKPGSWKPTWAERELHPGQHGGLGAPEELRRGGARDGAASESSA